MMVHFGNTFVRFAGRFDREVEEAYSAPTSKSKDVKAASPSVVLANENAESKAEGWKRWMIPVVVVTLITIGLLGSAIPRAAKDGAINWYRVGQIPAQDEGRLMPLDSVARRFVQTLSGATYTVLRGDPTAKEKDQREDRKVSAVEFLFALANGDALANDAKVFRIDAEELRGLLDLNPNDSGGLPGGLFGQKLKHRYSLNQLRPKIERFFAESDKVIQKMRPPNMGGQGLQAADLDFKERKLLELRNKLNLFLSMRDAFGATPIPLPKPGTSEEEMQQLATQFRELSAQMESLESNNLPGVVPPVLAEEAYAKASEKEKTWRPLNPAVFDMQRQAFIDVGFDDTATKSAYNVFEASGRGSVKEFHRAVEDHIKYVAGTPVGKVIGNRVEFEAWYNKFNPFTQSIAYYSIAVVLALLSFVFFRQSLRRAAFWICAVIFVVHTVALITRIYISQRPPVINLYSSAVYIGWAAVLSGLIIEKLYPIRLGLLVGSVMGVLTLLVAWGLDTSDTMPVLQAVLDTQFWLTTHVQCITLGYAATFFAGFIGIYALFHRMYANKLNAADSRRVTLFAEQKILYKLCYGIVCFGLFFSFIGTVLGGLWADDSWGRFWGWDPKENGALMIVLWNAILLHARWDKLILERGFYLLAIGGNIMTAWSWFGTNQLGIGLHSYGFTESVLFILTLFVISQIAIIIIGLIFLRPNDSKLSNAS